MEAASILPGSWGKFARMACKPDFVQGPNLAADALWMTIPLPTVLPRRSSCHHHHGDVIGKPLTPWQTILCGAFPGVAPAGRYPAPFLHGVRTFLGACTPRSSSHPREAGNRRKRAWDQGLSQRRTRLKASGGFHTPAPAAKSGGFTPPHPRGIFAQSGCKF